MPSPRRICFGSLTDLCPSVKLVYAHPIQFRGQYVSYRQIGLCVALNLYPFDPVQRHTRTRPAVPSRMEIVYRHTIPYSCIEDTLHPAVLISCLRSFLEHITLSAARPGECPELHTR
ncbi:hypothetical protein BD311DRAFT_768311 [Dichomitus squalens]|uniref:Uncharacterized protein n=1 Tax=Dichomitus squalens TaxID=114155 RepID=A0A4Q9M8U6_9APHY|nr:hypothetical protein BD311DRAFT_768311 [Dichomitus squalens]